MIMEVMIVQMYTNRFTVAANQDKSEFVIDFYQTVPKVPVDPEGGSATPNLPTEIHPVSNLVMSGQTAVNLIKAVQSILEADGPINE